ncbi:hypothetical protein H0H87_000703 [Tephrocybe sp. NHM501043]|nr:hypothetical protein H0H87_000703 [Tephrocybe sp. NHM501043]
MEYLSGGQVQWKDDENRPLLPTTTEDHYDDALFTNESDLMKRIGTPTFLAPEVLWFPDDDVVHHQQATSVDSLTPKPVVVTNKLSRQPHRPSITHAIDIWSLAVTLYCLLFGHTPFSAPESTNENAYHNEFALYNQICTQDWNVDEAMGMDQISTGGRYPKGDQSEGSMVVSLLEQMLKKDPAERIILSKIKSFVEGPDHKVNLPKSGQPTSANNFTILLTYIPNRVLHLADVTAPRLGTSTREDEAPGLLNRANSYELTPSAKKLHSHHRTPYHPMTMYRVILETLKLEA